MTIKHEADTSPAGAVLADRLAKYAYTSPSPSRRTPSKVIAIKAESSLPGHQTSPALSRARTTDHPVKVEPRQEVVSLIPSSSDHNMTGGQVAGPSNWTTRSDDDLESLTEEVEYTPLRRSTRTSGRRSQRAPFDVLSQPATSSGDEAYPSDVSLEEEPDGRTRTQKRIKSRRAMGQERCLVTAPDRDRGGEAASSSTDTRSKRRRVDRVDDGEAERIARNSPRRSRPRAYADPEVYGHLRPLPDIMAPDLDGTDQIT